jgi:hypothetical protein
MDMFGELPGTAFGSLASLPTEVISKTAPTSVNAHRQQLDALWGRNLSYQTDFGRHEWDDNGGMMANVAQVARPFTVITLIRDSGSGQSRFWSTDDGDTAFRVGVQNTVNEFTLFCNGSNQNNRVSSVTDIRDGLWRVCIATAEQGDDRVWIDGVRDEGSDTTGNDPVWTAPTRVTIGAQHGGGFTWRGDWACFYVLNRGITDAQARMISEDPFGPFRPWDDTPVPVPTFAPQLFLPHKPAMRGWR